MLEVVSMLGVVSTLGAVIGEFKAVKFQVEVTSMFRFQPGVVKLLRGASGEVNGEVRMQEEISTLKSQPGALRILGGISTFRAHPTSILGELSQLKVWFRVWLRFQFMGSRILRSRSYQARSIICMADVSHQ
jgi:hypothetical protein